MLLALCLVLPLAVIQGFQLNTFAPFLAWFDGNNPMVKFAVNSINDYYAKQGDTTPRTYLSVLQSESQISPYTDYKFTLRVAAGSQTQICHVEVMSTLGDISMYTVGDPVCDPEHKDSRRAGGNSPVATYDPDVQKALNFAVDRLNAMENFLFLRTVTGIDHVTSQIVSGISYHFFGVQMVATSCNKMSQHQLSNCPAVTGDNANTRTCDFDVWWQSWMVPEYQLLNVHCT